MSLMSEDGPLVDLTDMFRRHPVIITSAVLTGASLFFAKRYFAGGVCRSRAQLVDKTVIITGANAGIGRETARDLAGRGARVILACRDVTKAERVASKIREETGNGNVVVRVVDLASLQSVRRFAEEIMKKEPRIDILINNAGIMACPRWESEEGYEMQLAVNHLGHFLLTNLLLDRIQETENSRIVNVSSLAHERGRIHWDNLMMTEDYVPWAAYSQSKLANVLFTHELHKRLKDRSTSVFALHPGVVKTELGRYMMMSWSSFKRLFTIPVIWFFFKTPNQGAQTTIYCAVQEGLESQSGKYFSDCRAKNAAPQAQNDEDAARLWDVSAKLVGLDKS